MSYADEDLHRASKLIAEWGTKAGVDVSAQVRALCLEFMEVRRLAFDTAALTVETCPVPSDWIHQLQYIVMRDRQIAHRIRELKGRQ